MRSSLSRRTFFFLMVYLAEVRSRKILHASRHYGAQIEDRAEWESLVVKFPLHRGTGNPSAFSTELRTAGRLAIDFRPEERRYYVEPSPGLEVDAGSCIPAEQYYWENCVSRLRPRERDSVLASRVHSTIYQNYSSLREFGTIHKFLPSPTDREERLASRQG